MRVYECYLKKYEKKLSNLFKILMLNTVFIKMIFGLFFQLLNWKKVQCLRKKCFVLVPIDFDRFIETRYSCRIYFYLSLT